MMALIDHVYLICDDCTKRINDSTVPYEVKTEITIPALDMVLVHRFDTVRFHTIKVLGQCDLCGKVKKP